MFWGESLKHLSHSTECRRTAMPASTAAAILRMWTQRGPHPQAVVMPRVVRARRAAQNSPEKMGATAGHPKKGPERQVGVAGLSHW